MRCSRRGAAMWMALRVVVLAWVGCMAWPAYGQSADLRLRSEVTIAERLTDEHHQQIDAYIRHWTARLQDESDEQVAAARQRLMEPLRGGQPSEAFVDHYSTRVSNQIMAALDSDRLIVRLNTMIVATRLTSAAAMPLIQQGMADENPAVRYWAVKAVQRVGFTPREERDLLDQLVEHLEGETEASVTEQVMLAMLDLDLNTALMRGLEVLNARVDRHLAEPGRSLQAEYAGLQRAYRQLAGAGNPDQQALRQLARAAVRYQDLAGRQLAAEAVTDDVRGSYVQLIQLCSATLQFVGDSFNVSGLPASAAGLVNQQNWTAVRRNADDWRAVLRRSPIDLSEQDMAVTLPEPEPTETE